MLLNNISLENFRVVLIKICKDVLTMYAAKDVQALLHRLKNCEAATPLVRILETFVTFCRCAATLLQVSGIDHGAESVQYFAAYKGPGIFEKAIQAILTKEVDSIGKKTKSTVESREVIHKMVQDVMRTAASVKVQQPQFDLLLEGLSSDDPSFTLLQEAWEKLPSFRTGLREGACKPLEDLLISVAKAKGDNILSGNVDRVSSRDLHILLAILKEFPRQAGILDLQTSLMKWAQKNNDMLAGHELETILQDFIDANSKFSGKRGKFTALDVNAVKEAVQKCGGKIPAKLGPLVHLGTFLYLKAASDHVTLVEIALSVAFSFVVCFFSWGWANLFVFESIT